MPDPVQIHCLTMCICVAVYLGVCQYKYFQSNLFDLRPDLGEPYCSSCSPLPVLDCALSNPAGEPLSSPSQLQCVLHAVNELYGRTFATWTITTCVLCLICAKNPRVPAIYGGWSLLLAEMHMHAQLKP